MAAFELQVLPSVEKDLKKIPKADLLRILSRIEELREDPRPTGSLKLSGLDHYRIRQGNYRIIYKIQDDKLVIVIVKVGHRRDIYR